MNIKEIEIQLLTKKIYPEVFQTVQFDSKRILKFTLTDYELTDEIAARFSAKKPSGKPILNECFIRDGFIFYKITKQTVAETGITNCQLILYDKVTGEEITSLVFKMDVQKKLVSDECMTSTADWGVIETLKNEMTEIYDEVLKVMENYQPLDITEHIKDLNNPHDVTPNKIGTYDKTEIDNKIVTIEAMNASDILNICN